MSRYLYLVVVTSILLTSHSAIGETQFRNIDTGTTEAVLDHHQPGKWLVLMIWASDCGVCNKEAHQYVAFHEKHQASTAVVLGLTTDGVAKKKEADAFVARHQVNFNNLIGEWQEVATFYQELTDSDWIGTPSFLIFSRDGNLAVKQVGAVPAELIEQYIDQQENS
jgi:peroxiredoxin